MKTVFAVIGFVVVALVVGTCVACNDDDDESLNLGRTFNEQAVSLTVPVPPARFVASHERERCYDGDCGDQSYDQWRNEDRNRNRNRNRGAFSPGPFDDSPVDAFNGNVICLPGSTCYSDDRRRDENPPPEQRTQSEDVVCTLRNLPYHCDAKPEGTS